ncbi:MAG TPA: transglutaminase domain-containing protein [Phototrophicaceae bacterium]|jgi:hypothetical protein|nr:transglutaminase domain-containing protein [Phototrophicaceae bacterium]
MLDPVRYYGTQSHISDPGSMAYLYDSLPDDIPGLCRVAQGLIYHYMAGQWIYGWQIPRERIAEIDTRYAENILKRIIELDNRPITEARPPEKRFVGCCRDFSLIFASMARHKGYAVRNRSGFGAYFMPDYYMDHVVSEIWDPEAQRWYLVDAQMSPEEIKAHQLKFDVLDVPRDQFIVAGQAWQMCRKQGADAERFGLGPGVPIKGWGFITTRLLQDIAALNKQEMLCWDEWTISAETYEPTEDNLKLLDKVAALSQGDRASIEELQGLYQTDARLTVPETVQCYSPAYPGDQLPIPVKVEFA